MTDVRVDRERRERERRERERRRAERSARPEPPRAATRRRERVEQPAAPVAARESHEGLVSWLARSIANVPTVLVAILRGFALEVVAVVTGSLGAVLRLVPGGSRMLSAQRTVRARAQAARTAMPAREPSAADDAPVIAPAGRPRRELTAAEQRERQRGRMLLRRRLRLVLLVACIGSFVAAWIYVPSSDAFRIRHVEVTGASSVGDLEARTLVDDMLRGQTVFTVDEDAVARRLEELPFVRSARVERHLPGGLELRLVEYRPLALAYGDKDYWLVAQDGRILARASREEWGGRIPLVTLRQKNLKPGVVVEDEPALRVLAAREAGSTLVLQMVRYEQFRIVGRIEGGIEIRFGGPVELRQKVLVAELMLREARRKDLDPVYIDVSVPSKPAICAKSDAACLLPRSTSKDEAKTDAKRAAATTGDQKAASSDQSGGDEQPVDEADSGQSADATA